MPICLLPGCNIPIPENGSGRPRDYCSDAHKQAAFRFVHQYLKRRGVIVLLIQVSRAVAAWRSLHCRYDYDDWRKFQAAMNAIAAHPLVGSRAAGRPAVPSSQPLPGAAPSSSNDAGQGGEAR